MNKIRITKARIEDAGEILSVQKLAFQDEAAIYGDYSLPPLLEKLEETRKDFDDYIIIKAVYGKKIVGSVRGRVTENRSCYIGRLTVHPNFQNKGIGRRLMNEIEGILEQTTGNSGKYELFTGEKSLKNISLYQKLGYRITGKKKVNQKLTTVRMEKGGFNE